MRQQPNSEFVREGRKKRRFNKTRTLAAMTFGAAIGGTVAYQNHETLRDNIIPYVSAQVQSIDSSLQEKSTWYAGIRADDQTVAEPDRLAGK